MALTALAAQANYTMASYSTMNTVPAADVESETPLLSRDIKVNAKALLGGAAAAAFVLGMLAATAVNMKAPVRSTSLSALPVASDLEPLDLAGYAQPYWLDSFDQGLAEVHSKIIAADTPKLDMPAGTFWYNDGTYYDSNQDKFMWKNPPFGGAGDDNTAIYNYDLTLADDGMYKLWRDGAGGWYTVEIQWSQAPRGAPYR